MARLFDGSNDYVAALLDLTPYTELSLSFWLWWDAFANDDDLAFEHTVNYTANPGGLIVNPNSSSTKFEVGIGTGAGAFYTDTFSRPSAAAWHHYLVTLSRSGPANAVWVDGVSQTLTAGTHTVVAYGTFANDYLVFMARGGVSLFGAGRMAEIGLYGGVLLGQDDATALAAGYSPLLVRSPSLSFYWPFIGRTQPEIELRQSAVALFHPSDATAYPTVEDHPRVIYPSRRRVQRWPAASAARRYLLVRN